MTLTEFLLARLADQRADAPTIHEAYCDLVTEGRVDPGFGWECTCGVPACVLADAEAKRRIVESCRADYEDAMSGRDDTVALATEVLRALALPYADHPDYASVMAEV